MPAFDRSVSSCSLASSATRSEFSDSDWDRSTSDLPSLVRPATPQRHSSSSSFQSSSIIFPASASLDPMNEHTPRRRALTEVPTPMDMDDVAEANAEAEITADSMAPRLNGKRTLSDLLCRRVGSASEAHRIADVLGQWINASSSPYEPETDDFFSPSPSCSSSVSTPASPASRSTPHTPSSASSAAFDFNFRMSTAPGRRGSITNRGGVTVIAPASVSTRSNADATSISAQPQPPTEGRNAVAGQA